MARKPPKPAWHQMVTDEWQAFEEAETVIDAVHRVAVLRKALGPGVEVIARTLNVRQNRIYARLARV